MVSWRRDWYKCRKCGSIIRATDYNWQDYHLYASLKEERICEQCKRIEGNERT